MSFFFLLPAVFFFFFFPPSWWQWLSNQSCTSFRSPKNEGLFLPACQIVEIKAISFSNHWMEFLPNIVILTFCGKVQFCFKASLNSAAVRPVCSGGQPGLPVSSLSPDGHFVRALSRCFSGSNQSLSHCPIMRWPETAGEMCVVLTRTAQLFWLCYIMLTLLSEDVGAQAEQFLFFFFGHSSFTMLLFFFSIFNISNKVYLNKTTVPPTMLTQTKCYFVQLSYEQRVRRGGEKKETNMELQMAGICRQYGDCFCSKVQFCIKAASVKTAGFSHNI